MYGESDVYIYPTEVWQYIQENRDYIRDNNVIIAENLRDGVEITLETDQVGSAVIAAYIDDKLVETERVVSYEDAANACRKYYANFLIPKHADYKQEEEIPELDPSIDDEIEMRERELGNTFMDFLDVVLFDEDLHIMSEEYDELLDEILALISSYGHDVYRPCYLEEDDGTTTFTEYPYGEHTAEEEAEEIETTPGDRVEIHP